MQADGNFVVYNQNNAVWASNTNGQGSAPFNLIMQSDGNLVVYANTQNCQANTACTPTWASNTAGNGTGPYNLVMQDDGNLVIYDSTNTATWATGTNQFQNIITSESAPLTMGQALTSPNGVYRAVMQTDGNFVVYHGTHATLGHRHNWRNIFNGLPNWSTVRDDLDTQWRSGAPRIRSNVPHQHSVPRELVGAISRQRHAALHAHHAG